MSSCQTSAISDQDPKLRIRKSSVTEKIKDPKLQFVKHVKRLCQASMQVYPNHENLGASHFS